MANSNAGKNNSSDGQFDPAERMLNIFLRDYLANQNPPEFEQRIHNRLKAREAGVEEPPTVGRNAPSFSHEELDEALGAAQADIEFGKPELSPSVNPSKRNTGSVDPLLWDYLWIRRITALSTLAASVFIAGFLTKSLWAPPLLDRLTAKRSQPKDPKKGSDRSALANGGVPERKLPTLDRTESATETQIASQETPVPASIDHPSAIASRPAEITDKDTVAVTPSISATGNSNSSIASSAFDVPVPIPRGDLVSVINGQLMQMWNRLSAGSKLTNDEDVWLDRVTESAIGRTPTSTERQIFRNRSSSTRQQETVDQLVHSEEFQIHWSELLAEQYLQTRLPAVRNRTSDQARFVDWLKTKLSVGTSLGSIDRSLYAPSEADLTAEANDSFSASRYLLNELSRIAMLSTDRLRDHSQTKQHHADTDLISVNVARNILFQTGNGNVGCMQCHSSNASELNIADLGDRRLDRNFWSVSASMQRFRSIVEPNEKRKRPELFYESEDGRMLLAQPELVFQGTDTERVAFQDWVERSTSARFGTVELAWEKIVRQPLVPPFGLDETEGAQERRDLKELLAQQVQATGSIQSAVGAILLSDVMKVSEANVTSAWYLKSNENLLSKYHAGARVFAFLPARTLRSAMIPKTNLTQVAKWLDFDRARPATLAQPDSKRLPLSSAKNSDKELDDEQVRYLMTVDLPYKRLDRLAKQIDQSKLSWNDKVNHIYLATQGRYPTRQELFEAGEFLEFAGQNHIKAMVMIVTSSLGSW